MYRKKALWVLSFVLLLLLVPVYVFAHGGSLDGNGGHYNRSTGEYHFHHGYPAHQHPGGDCEYLFDDQTNRSPGNSSSSRSSRYNSYSSQSGGGSGIGRKKSTSSSKESSSSESSSSESEKEILESNNKSDKKFSWTGFLMIIFIAGAVLISRLVFKEYKKALIIEEQRKFLFEFAKKYSGKPLEECVNIPCEFEIGSDGLPKEYGADGWGILTVYITKRGSCYHTNTCQTKASIKVNLATVRRYKSCTLCKAPVINLNWYFKYLVVKKDFECAKIMQSDDYVKNKLKS